MHHASKYTGPTDSNAHRNLINPKILMPLPVEYVEEPVQPQTGHVVAGDVLHLLYLHYHVQLWVDGDRFKPDRVRPRQFEQVGVSVDQQSQQQRY